MRRLITRLPIVDRYENVYGYELVSRPAAEEVWPLNAAGAGDDLPSSAPTFAQIDEITDGAHAFIKCTRDALITGRALELPRGHVILEVFSTGKPDGDMFQACRGLKNAGFPIALANFHGAWEEPLADIADIIKLDVTACSDRTQWLLMKKHRSRGAVFVAEKVDKRPQFQAAVQQGFSYFQGQFYCRPQPFATTEVSPTKLVYLLVLAAVTRPEINMQEVANTIKHDLALSYQLLRFLNSARFAFHSRIKSIRHALLLLGQDELRKWIGMVSVAALGEGGPPILVKTALIRAAFCEALALLVGGASKRQTDYFFLGLLSCIDVLMRRPMRVLLTELPIAPDVGAALMGEENTLCQFLKMVMSYETGNWEECSQLAKKLGLRDETLGELYLQALHWSHELAQEGKTEPVEATGALVGSPTAL
jgi:EAL and modified HD-GYP domain-containing signal transduction protein